MSAAELAAALAEGIKAGLLGEGFAVDQYELSCIGPYALVPTPEVHRLMAEHFPVGAK